MTVTFTKKTRDTGEEFIERKETIVFTRERTIADITNDIAGIQAQLTKAQAEKTSMEAL